MKSASALPLPPLISERKFRISRHSPRAYLEINQSLLYRRKVVLPTARIISLILSFMVLLGYALGYKEAIVCM